MAIRRQYGPQLFSSSGDSINLDIRAIGLPKRSPLQKAFNWAIKRLHEAGIMKRLLSMLTEEHSKERLARKKLLQFTERFFQENVFKKTSYRNCFACTIVFSDVQSIFLLYIFGSTCSMSSFAIEIGIKLMKKHFLTK